MSTPHAFDSSLDGVYDANYLPDVYLTEEQVSAAIQNIQKVTNEDIHVLHHCNNKILL